MALLAVCGFAVHAAGEARIATAVEKWGVFELTLNGPTDGNPFIDVRVAAVFTNHTRAIEANGFYDGDGVYRVRFMPDTTGEWRYETRSNRWELTGKTGQFTATSPTGGNHGPVRIHNTFHFAYADGTPFKQIGTTIYNWTDAPEEWQEQTLKTLATAPFNKARMLLLPHQEKFRKAFAPPRWPFLGTPPRAWDFTRFNPDFFRHYERRIAQLRDLGIEADVILFHPYGKPWGFDTMDAATDERYVRYVVARLAAFRNVWWSMANEFDFIRTKTMADWDHVFQTVQQNDPYDHLRSIHNGFVIYDHNKPWVTHASIQNGSAVEEAGRAELYRDVWRKPVVYDEVKYEGDSRRRWGNLSGREMVHRFWSGTVAGTYVGHGDFFYRDETDTWTAFGGTLHGESAPRLAFLRKILEEGPADGIDPIDKWQDPRTAGEPGRYYLVYFGHEAPSTWRFELFRNGVVDGQRYRIEIIDTWDMTITPVPGEYVAKKKDDYHYIDAQNRAVSLPAKPGIALRILRIGENDQPLNTEPPQE